jgi:hydroxymethylpyrimidine pyrophosphatase-like HAD family hydrolase
MQSSGGPVIKMVCIYRREEECKEFKESFQNIKDITAVSTMGIDIEITAGEAAKGHALGTLCRELEIDSRDVFAIGDSENDVSMRTYAGCLVAMGNAAQSLIDTADHITGSVHEDGAARAIRQYICGLE